MEDPISFFSSPKNSKRMSTARRGMIREQREQVKEPALARKTNRTAVANETKRSTDQKTQISPKSPTKEQKKPSNFKLHTEERASRRAGYNDLVASKISSLEILRRFEEKIQKVLDEEEIRILRKEMVPKAQLMPFFDRPFLPQRSRRPLTVPKEPSFLMNRKSCGGDDRYTYYQYFRQQEMKANIR